MMTGHSEGWEARGRVAQLVAHRVWDAGVRGSSPRTPTACGRRQVVRHQPSKLTFTGSNPVARSGIVIRSQHRLLFSDF